MRCILFQIYEAGCAVLGGFLSVGHNLYLIFLIRSCVWAPHFQYCSKTVIFLVLPRFFAIFTFR